MTDCQLKKTLKRVAENMDFTDFTETWIFNIIQNLLDIILLFFTVNNTIIYIILIIV